MVGILQIHDGKKGAIMGKKQLRAVLVGCGGISNAWLQANRQIDELEIVGLVDINPSAAEAQKEKYDLADAVTGREMEWVVEQTTPDLVFDCTIPEAHQQVAVTAMEMGCDVLG
jgi:predicted dehydrogenase